MTVAELLKKKRDLEKKLNTCIYEFEVDTGVEISNMFNLRRYEHSDLTGKDIKVPDIHVTLDL